MEWQVGSQKAGKCVRCRKRLKCDHGTLVDQDGEDIFTGYICEDCYAIWFVWVFDFAESIEDERLISREECIRMFSEE